MEHDRPSVYEKPIHVRDNTHPQWVRHQIVLRVFMGHGDEGELKEPYYPWIHHQAFTQAAKILQNHPQLTDATHLRISHSSWRDGCVAMGLPELFESLGPLEKLTLHNCDFRPYLQCSDFRWGSIRELVVFSLIKEFTI